VSGAASRESVALTGSRRTQRVVTATLRCVYGSVTPGCLPRDRVKLRRGSEGMNGGRWTEWRITRGGVDGLLP